MCNKIVDNMWEKYDNDNNLTLEFDEIVKFATDSLKKMKGENAVIPSEEEMLKTFNGYDKDHNGHIDKQEMKNYLSA